MEQKTKVIISSGGDAAVGQWARGSRLEGEGDGGFFGVFCLFVVFGCCREACGILVPQPGINPCPLHWEHRVLTTGQPGKSREQFLWFLKYL